METAITVHLFNAKMHIRPQYVHINMKIRYSSSVNMMMVESENGEVVGSVIGV